VLISVDTLELTVVVDGVEATVLCSLTGDKLGAVCVVGVKVDVTFCDEEKLFDGESEVLAV